MDIKKVSIDWLNTQALPLWLTKGVNPWGGFEEAMTLTGVPHAIPRRAMVQARQMYALRTARQMKLVAPDRAHLLMAQTADFLIKNFARPDGSFRHSVRPDLQANSEAADLYTQAFALFGMAQAYAELKNVKYKTRALEVVHYLKSQRHLPGGGYSEFAKDGGIVYQSNPHMHLFEAYVTWLEIDDDPQWRRFAQEILDLALTRFIEPKTGLLVEHFDDQWLPILQQGRFAWEPGHQYEWAWLMNKYQTATKAALPERIMNLVMNAERFGINAQGAVYDELWSDLSVKAPTSRFWPQCERIKACSALGLAESADQGMVALMRFFVTPTPGLWFDRMNPDGTFHEEPARASSLYHIIGAIAEYEAGV